MAYQPMAGLFPILSRQQTAAGSALSTAGDISDLITKHLAQQRAQSELPYAGPAAQQGIYKSQADTALATAQAHEANARSGLYGADAQRKMLMLDYMRGVSPGTTSGSNQLNSQTQLSPGQKGSPSVNSLDQGNGNSSIGNTGQLIGGPSSQPVTSDQSQEDSMYGVPIPTKPTPQEIQVQAITGGKSDPFQDRRKIALTQIAANAKEMNDRSQKYNTQYQQMNQFSQLNDQYKSAMDNAKYSGPTSGHIPAALDLSGNSQKVEDIVKQMAPLALENVKQAIGNSRVTNVDSHIAMNSLPNRLWSPSEQQFFTQWMNAAKDRTQEKIQFHNLIMNNPELKNQISPGLEDTMWSQYANDYPIASDLPENGGKVQKGNLNRSLQYLTPNAIQSFKTNGSWASPDLKNKNSEPNYPSPNQIPGNSPEAINQSIPQSQTSAQAISNQFSPNKLSAGSKILSNNLQLPSFNSKQEFQQWLKSQPQITKDAVKRKLGLK